MSQEPREGIFGPAEEHHWSPSFFETVERWHQAVELRNREYAGRALLFGEEAARAWLDAQPTIEFNPPSA